jgi:hypothetical protein
VTVATTDGGERERRDERPHWTSATQAL